MQKIVKIKPESGYNNLVKNTFNKAIVNCDDDGYKSYMTRREKSKAINNKIESLEHDINNIKSDISLILSLLQNK